MSGENHLSIWKHSSSLNIPVGTQVHCVEMKPGKGAQIARSAGTVAQIVAMEGDYVTLKLKIWRNKKKYLKPAELQLVR